MTDEKRLVLKIISGLLDYPGHPGFWTRVQERALLAEELDTRLGAMSKAVQQIGSIELEKLYVAAFDFDVKGSLYVTAHEMGDSRDRGQALIELTELYRQAGYEVPDDQLADFLPMMLELAAVHPEMITPPLIERMALVAGQIGENLGPDHIYSPVFDAMQDALGRHDATVVPSVEENPDLVDLPYPIEYP